MADPPTQAGPSTAQAGPFTTQAGPSTAQAGPLASPEPVGHASPPGPLVLASRSPQRAAILTQLGVAFTVRPADVEEASVGDPVEVAAANARAKALAVPAAPEETVIGVDTLVALGNEIFGKPRDAADARATLAQLQGATHRVISGLCVRQGDVVRETVAVTLVTFRPLTDAQADAYVATGEWRDRAGGYAIQLTGAALVSSLEGDYQNVVGLPVASLISLLPHLM